MRPPASVWRRCIHDSSSNSKEGQLEAVHVMGGAIRTAVRHMYGVAGAAELVYELLGLVGSDENAATGSSSARAIVSLPKQ